MTFSDPTLNSRLMAETAYLEKSLASMKALSAVVKASPLAAETARLQKSLASMNSVSAMVKASALTAETARLQKSLAYMNSVSAIAKASALTAETARLQNSLAYMNSVSAMAKASALAAETARLQKTLASASSSLKLMQPAVQQLHQKLAISKTFPYQRLYPIQLYFQQLEKQAEEQKLRRDNGKTSAYRDFISFLSSVCETSARVQRKLIDVEMRSLETSNTVDIWVSELRNWHCDIEDGLETILKMPCAVFSEISKYYIRSWFRLKLILNKLDELESDLDSILRTLGL